MSTSKLKVITKETSHRIGHRSRLRARFLKSGEDGIADYELLEIILFASNSRGDVKPLAKDLLKEFKSFYNVITAPESSLRKIKGVGDAAIVCIKSIEAAAKIMLKQKAQETPIISSCKAVVDYCRASMSNLVNEEFRVLFLDRKNHLMVDELVNKGTIDHAPVYPREIVKRAIDVGAGAVILVHNHPSGDPTPSKDDINITYKIQHALSNIDIKLHDHIIVGKHDYISFRDKGFI